MTLSTVPQHLWPISITKLAEEMGVSARTLTGAAKSGALKAWRIGGTKRGELVTTMEAVHEYLHSQPVVPAAEAKAVKQDKVTAIVDRALAKKRAA